MRLSPRAKLAGLIASLAIHGSALAFFADFSEDKGTAQAGLGGVEVALAPMGGAPGSEARAVESTETVKPTEVTEAVKPIETAEVPDVPVTPVEQARPVEPVKPIEPVKPVEPVKVKEEPEKVKMAEVPPPPPPPPVKPVVKKPEPPKPVQQPKPQQVAKAEPAPVQAEAAPAPSVAGSAGKSGAQDSQNAGTTNSTSASSGGGMPGSSADYLALVQAWLERHKEYPRRAQLRRIEGTAVLRFVMDREGKLVSYRLERGSGHSVLDEAVREMIERASPFPPLPPEIQQANLELVVPVSFYLR